MACGLPPGGAERGLRHGWRGYMRDAPTQRAAAGNGGPLLDNVSEGADVDITAIPTPIWHEHDGGHYIGTACMVVMKDPDSGWINYGAYRVQAHDANVASIMCSKGKHGNLIMRRYHERGEPCPLVWVCVVHPLLFMIQGL